MIQQRSSFPFAGEDLRPKYLSLWWLRILLGILFAFGSEVLLWSNPERRTFFDFLLVIITNIAISAIILDLAARYRIRNLYDAMAIIAIYGMLASLLIYPERTTTELPRMLGTRILGGYTLIGMEMFGLFLVLINGSKHHRIRLLIGWSICVGFAWAIWVRWSPSLIDWTPETVTFSNMLIYAAIFLIAALVIFMLLRYFAKSDDMQSAQLRLSVVEWLILLLLCFGVLIAQLSANTLSIPAVLLGILVLAACWVVLWFRRVDGGQTLLDNFLPIQPLSFLWIGVSTVIFLSVAAFVYQLPLVLIAGYSQFTVVEVAFVGVGFLWLPTIAAALGTETFSRQLKLYD